MYTKQVGNDLLKEEAVRRIRHLVSSFSFAKNLSLEQLLHVIGVLDGTTVVINIKENKDGD